jgi:hypothetical protein
MATDEEDTMQQQQQHTDGNEREEGKICTGGLRCFLSRREGRAKGRETLAKFTKKGQHGDRFHSAWDPNVKPPPHRHNLEPSLRLVTKPSHAHEYEKKASHSTRPRALLKPYIT